MCGVWFGSRESLAVDGFWFLVDVRLFEWMEEGRQIFCPHNEILLGFVEIVPHPKYHAVLIRPGRVSSI